MVYFRDLPIKRPAVGAPAVDGADGAGWPSP